MFPANYFGPVYFAARYWPKVGSTAVFNPIWAVNSNRTIGMEISPE
jgi:hypothetical protein